MIQFRRLVAASLAVVALCASTSTVAVAQPTVDAPSVARAAAPKPFGLSAKVRFGDEKKPLPISAVAPAGTTKLKVQKRVGTRWVSSSKSIGKVRSVRRNGSKVMVSASAIPAFGNNVFRIAGRRAGALVVSKTITLQGYRWMPLTKAFYDDDPAEYVNINGVAYPRAGYVNRTDDECCYEDTVTVPCRKFEVGVWWDPHVKAGSIKFAFATDRGMYKEFARTRDQGDGVSTISTDGSRFTLTRSWDDVDVNLNELDDYWTSMYIKFVARAWCSGIQG